VDLAENTRRKPYRAYGCAAHRPAGPEIAPFGIRAMLVEPGFFRTDLLTPESTSYAAPAIEDYRERTEQTVTAWQGMNGQQGGDPAKLAAALIQVVGSAELAGAVIPTGDEFDLVRVPVLHSHRPGNCGGGEVTRMPAKPVTG
jgi:hypothetical protein